MKYTSNWLKYLSPIFGILFCPVTILFLWSILSAPQIGSGNDLVEDVKPLIK